MKYKNGLKLFKYDDFKVNLRSFNRLYKERNKFTESDNQEYKKTEIDYQVYNRWEQRNGLSLHDVTGVKYNKKMRFSNINCHVFQ